MLSRLKKMSPIATGSSSTRNVVVGTTTAWPADGVKNLSFDSASQHRAPTAVFFVSLPLWTPSLSDVLAADWTRIVRPIGVLTAL